MTSYATKVIRDLLADTEPNPEITNEFRIKITHWEGEQTHHLSISRTQVELIAAVLDVNLNPTDPEE